MWKSKKRASWHFSVNQNWNVYNYRVKIVTWKQNLRILTFPRVVINVWDCPLLHKQTVIKPSLNQSDPNQRYWKVVHMTKWFIRLHCSLFGSQVSLLWVFAFTPELSTSGRIAYTRDWGSICFFSGTAFSLLFIPHTIHYKQPRLTETRYRLN